MGEVDLFSNSSLGAISIFFVNSSVPKQTPNTAQQLQTSPLGRQTPGTNPQLQSSPFSKQTPGNCSSILKKLARIPEDLRQGHVSGNLLQESYEQFLGKLLSMAALPQIELNNMM